MSEPLDVNQIEEEIAGLVQGSDDPAGKGPNTYGIRRRPFNLLHRTGPEPGPADNQPVVEEDPINPSHYRRHPSGVECIEITEHMSFNTGNAVKYIWRYMDKGDPVENLRKAQWYLEREILRLTRVR